PSRAGRGLRAVAGGRAAHPGAAQGAAGAGPHNGALLRIEGGPRPRPRPWPGPRRGRHPARCHRRRAGPVAGATDRRARRPLGGHVRRAGGRRPRPHRAGADLASVTELPFADVWEAVARVRGTGPALVHGRRRVSWTQFSARADAGAAAFLATGVNHQDKVANYLYNGREYLESFFATLKAGLVPADTTYRHGR